MSFADSNGTRLYVESTGTGTPVVFVHEFASNFRNWEPQVRFFSRRFQCITFNARGYPPSDVPEDIAQYSQAQAVEDIANVMKHSGVARAHIVGLSMGGYAAVNFGISHPEMVRSLVIAGAGHGTNPARREQFLKDSEELAAQMLAVGIKEAGAGYINGPLRRRFPEKDSRGFEEFKKQFEGNSALGSALTMRGCQLRRPTIYELKDKLSKITAPTLIISGDDDDPCLDPAIFMKRHIPDARLWIVPRTTHTVNLEEPAAFNREVMGFLIESDLRGQR